MKRSEMVCTSCIKFDGSRCRCLPQPLSVEEPQTNWCTKGQWQKWSEQYQEMEPYYWGEWEVEV